MSNAVPTEVAARMAVATVGGPEGVGITHRDGDRNPPASRAAMGDGMVSIESTAKGTAREQVQRGPRFRWTMRSREFLLECRAFRIPGRWISLI